MFKVVGEGSSTPVYRLSVVGRACHTRDDGRGEEKSSVLNKTNMSW